MGDQCGDVGCCLVVVRLENGQGPGQEEVQEVEESQKGALMWSHRGVGDTVREGIEVNRFNDKSLHLQPHGEMKTLRVN